MTVLILVMLLGAASALIYLLRRQWADAALVLIASAALGAMLAGFTMPGMPAKAARIDASGRAPHIGDAASVHLTGDGLRAAQWEDLPRACRSTGRRRRTTRYASTSRARWRWAACSRSRRRCPRAPAASCSWWPKTAR
ncbi:hypothetical protein LP420_17410 [Massilia sp. B-10]|nr:hypothetical protein LP420_17410 [Massilia sp. B-10]